jgi:hypothetical protein
MAVILFGSSGHYGHFVVKQSQQISSRRCATNDAITAMREPECQTVIYNMVAFVALL